MTARPSIRPMDDRLPLTLRRADPDRYFTALFAPAAHRGTLLTLYAFNHELARAREVTREPGLALIRLQWWREIVQGAALAHEVATPLRLALAEGRLNAPDLLAMVDAREAEVEDDFTTESGWQDWLLQGAGSLAAAAGRALGAPAQSLDRLRRLGAGYALAGQLRSIAAFARQGRCLLPAETLAAHGLSAAMVMADPQGRAVCAVCAGLASVGRTLLGRAEPCGGAWISAALPAVLGRRDLARPGQAGPRSPADRLAVIIAALRRSA